MRSSIYIALGFIYSIILTFCGLVATGMGHGKGTGIFWCLALLPIPLVFWSLIGFLLCRAESKKFRFVIYILLAVHYLSFFGGYFFFLNHSSYEDFSAVFERDKLGVIFNIVFYLAGQFFIFYKLFAAEKHKLQ